MPSIRNSREIISGGKDNSVASIKGVRYVFFWIEMIGSQVCVFTINFMLESL